MYLNIMASFRPDRNPGLFVLGVLVFISCVLAAGCTGTSAEDDTGTKTLKMATLNVIKTPSYLGDYNFGLMNAIANPSLLRWTATSNIIGNVAKEWYATTICTGERSSSTTRITGATEPRDREDGCLSL